MSYTFIPTSGTARTLSNVDDVYDEAEWIAERSDYASFAIHGTYVMGYRKRGQLLSTSTADVIARVYAVAR